MPEEMKELIKEKKHLINTFKYPKPIEELSDENDIPNYQPKRRKQQNKKQSIPSDFRRSFIDMTPHLS